MPYALVLPLRPCASMPLPAALNECAHAAFFALLAQADADVATRLHGMEERKPFTLCPLFARQDGEPRRARGGETLSGLRLTLLDDSLFVVVAHALLANTNPAPLCLGDAAFAVTNVWLTGEAHPLAGGVTYSDLAAGTYAPALLGIRFQTPTVFRSQKRDVLWPEPRLLWQSWARAWAAFAPDNAGLPDEAQIMAWAAQVTVAQHRLETRTVRLGGSLQAGFAGVCGCDLTALDEAGRRALTTLADFAFYAGTGRKTAMGMGQTRRA